MRQITKKYCIYPPGCLSGRSKCIIMADPPYFRENPDCIFPDQEPPLFFARIALFNPARIPGQPVDQPVFHDHRKAAKDAGQFSFKMPCF
jgi:hypothetical protein